jgi:Holliday junction resolvase RusA-like endonuclease
MDDGASREYFLLVPFPPSVNTLIGKRYPPKDHKRCKEIAAAVANQACGGIPLTGGIEITYWFEKKDYRRWDIENMVKSLADGFTKGGLWNDDSQIDSSKQIRMHVNKKSGGWAYIHVKEISDICMLDDDTSKRA